MHRTIVATNLMLAFCLSFPCAFLILQLPNMGVLLHNRGHGKLVNNLSSAQFDLLVRVLSYPTSKRDFKSLLTLENIRQATNHPDKFVSQDIPRINYMRSTNARSRE